MFIQISYTDVPVHFGRKKAEAILMKMTLFRQQFLVSLVCSQLQEDRDWDTYPTPLRNSTQLVKNSTILFLQ